MDKKQTLRELLIDMACKYITHPHWGKNSNDKVLDQAESAIRELIEEAVPERKKYPDYGGASWNECCETILKAMRKL
jgi:hypothetical protein